jgi:hypothetical protein
LNGSWGRALQPGIPDTVETIIAEGVACARAGATIVHVHAYDGGGPQTYDWQVYARIIEGIRNQVDVPVYPSYPAFITAGSDSSPLADVAARFADIKEFAARGRRQGADLSSHILQSARGRPSAKAICARGLTCTPGGGSARRALDDCRRQRRSPPVVR